MLAACLATLAFVAAASAEVNHTVEAAQRRLGDQNGHRNQVVIMIFGETGSATDTEDEKAPLSCSLRDCPPKFANAMRWMTSVVLRSMLQSQRGDTDLLGNEPPTINVRVVPPFGADPLAPNGKEGDQRSAFRRTFFSFGFKGLTKNAAKEVSQNICRDYNRVEEELLKGVLVTLSKQELRPWQALDVVARMGYGLKSIIQLSTSVITPQGAPLIGAGCNWDVQAQSGTELGAFYLPSCPANSYRVEEENKPWKCLCNVGYEGTIQYTELETGLHDYRGECILVTGFCSGAYTMRRENGEIAQGVLNEEAYAECPTGFESTGLATCIARGNEGAWSPARLCRFVPPEEPPPPVCPVPFRMDLELQDCHGCKGELAPIQGTPCQCRTRCKDVFKQLEPDTGRYKHVTNFSDAKPIACINEPFRCPPEEALSWVPAEPEGMRCVMRETSEVLRDKDLCCPEAWEGSRPVDLHAAQCRDIRDEAECYRSMQADGDQKEKPCCWHKVSEDPSDDSKLVCVPSGGDEMSANPDEYGCAVPRQVPLAHWEKDGFPRCKKICKNNFKEFEPNVVATGCDWCVGDEPDCPCKVECAKGTIFMGGGEPSERKCRSGSFGEVPVCREPLALPSTCSLPSAAGLTIEGDCEDCEVGETCTCAMKCGKAGYKHVQGNGEEGAKACQLTDAPLQTLNCSEGDLSQLDCLHSKHTEKDSTGAEVPCCWRQGGFSDGTTRCAPMGSALIDVSHQPSTCASMKATTWDPPPPECAPVCKNPFASLPNVETNGKCDNCLPGEACGCKVSCVTGSDYYGGGPNGEERVCDPATRSFGEPPVCGEPDKPKPCDKSALWLVDRSLELAGCDGCRYDEEPQDCACSASCPVGTANIVDDSLRCEAQGALASATCSELQEADACLGSAQEGSGESCCWLGTAEEGAAVCLPKGSDLMAKLPLACAHPKAQWVGVPECKMKCKNTLRGGRYLDFKPNVEACDNCLAGEECKCNVQCAPGTIYCGGGPVGDRSCGTSPDLGEPPLCRSAEEKLQPCVSPSDSLFKLQGDCSGCAAEEACDCHVGCHERYKPTSGGPGPRTCIKADADLASKTCTEIKDQGECLQSSEAAGQFAGKPCCFHPSDDSGADVCSPLGSGLIDRPVKACAQQSVSAWDPPLPVCEPTCDDIFAGILGIEASGCSGCIVGDDSCPCEVKCADGFDFYGGPRVGKRSCPSSGHFEGPPLCGPKEPEPECRQTDIQGEGLGLEGCGACKAEDECDCKVSCAPGFMDAGTGGETGKKGCNKKVKPAGSAVCSEIVDSATCVASLEGDKPCIWQKEASEGWKGTCIVKESPLVTKVPEVGSYARLTFAEWDPMPTCMVKCTHDFASRSSKNVVPLNCDDCHVGQKMQKEGSDIGPDVCACTVKCREGTERYGGGSIGPRACSPSEPHFEPPPLCLPPEKAWCRTPSSPSFEVSGCGECEAGSSDCGPCSITCTEGYLPRGGSTDTEKTCKQTDASGALMVAPCGTLTDKTACLGSKEMIGPDNSQPCCYRARSFVPGGAEIGAVCAAKTSSEIPWDQPPDACAPLLAGVWQGLPTCTPTCANRFEGLQGITQEGCDKCAVSEECPCHVSCTPPARAMTGQDLRGMPYPEEGTKRCLLRNVRPVFEPPPICRSACKVPGTAQGTLDVSQCTAESRPDGEECFPGDTQCRCLVSCAADFRPVGGGTNGGQFYCNEAGVYQGLPVCRPLCKKPDEQFGQLDTSDCGLCVAGSPSCKCNLKCRGPRVGGGPEGSYTCLFQPGSDEPGDEVVARGAWVVADEKQRARLGEAGMQVPSCLSPVFITIKSATSKDGMSGVLVQVYFDGHLIASEPTGDDGQVLLDMIANEEVLVVASLEGYSTVKRKFKRTKFCLDPMVNCGMQLSMSRVLKSGKLNPDGCYFTTEASKGEWEMRAVLEWTNDPKDLDIWARNVDCALDVGQRYDCTGELSNCKRYIFTETGVAESEARGCSVRRCLSRDCITQVDRRGTPNCPERRYFVNQFPKWVTWRTRYLGDMEKRVAGRGTKRTKVVPIKASHVRIVTIAGFTAQPQKGFCEGRACSFLNGDFVEREGPDYVVGVRETYWKGSEFFIYQCRVDGTWVIAASSAFSRAREGSACEGYARSQMNRDLLDPAKTSFMELWDKGERAWKLRKGAAVSRLHLPDGRDLAWTNDNYMFLNVDHRTGYGPETVTFHNAPPGTYQIAVNTYSRNDVNHNIKGGKPSVSIYVGTSEQALFTCEIPPDCKNNSRIWNVVNIQMFDGGEEDIDGQHTGKTKYYIRLHDTYETMYPLEEVDLPTAHRPGKENRKFTNSYFSRYSYFVPGPSETYDDKQLKYICHGRCRAAPGYEQCMERHP